MSAGHRVHGQERGSIAAGAVWVTDSGLDIDALRIVAGGIDALRAPDRSIMVITRYPRLLELLDPDRVHVLDGGRIVRSGDHTLAHELEALGYVPIGSAPV